MNRLTLTCRKIVCDRKKEKKEREERKKERNILLDR